MNFFKFLHLSIKNKFENGTRHLILKTLTKIIPLYLVSEYPKSGGSWLRQLLSSYLDIPFPRNKMPKFGLSMFHGHYLPSRRFKDIKQIFYLVRDGRDIMVSDYFHSLIWNEKNRLDPKLVLYNRKKLNIRF